MGIRSTSPSQGAVTSVFGRVGAVIAALFDYAAAQISAVAHGTTSATDVQGQLDELTDEKADKTTTITANAPLSGGGDLSANRSLSVSDFGGDAGGGGSRGVVPAPAAGDGAANKFLHASGGWQTVPAGGGGITAINLSAGTTSNNSSAFTFADSKGVEWGINAGTITASVKTAYIGLNSAITNGSMTVNTSGISINLPNYLTTARASTDAIGLNTAQTNVTWTVNSSGLSFNAAGYAGTGATTATTAGTDMKVTHNTAGLSLAFPAAITTARASTDAIGLNTAQSNVTWTANSAGLSLDARGYAGTGTSATNASLTLNSNGLAINVAAGGAAITLSRWANLNVYTSGAMGLLGTNNGTMMIFPLNPILDYWNDNMTVSTVLFDVSLASANTSAQSFTMSFGIYTVANSTALSMLYQASTGVANAAATNNTTGWQGLRFLSFHSSQFSNSAGNATTPGFADGNTYYAAIVCKSAGQTKGMSFVGLQFEQTNQRSGTMNAASQNATSLQHYPFLGVYSSGSLPTGITRSSVNAANASAGFIPSILFENQVSAY